MNKYFTEKQIYASTFLGGPIPPGILIYKNLKRIGDDRKASLALMFTFLFTITLFYGLMQLPEEISDKIPSIVFTSLYTGFVYIIYHRYLANIINDKIIEEENKASNWHVAGFTLMGLVFNLLIILVFAFSQPSFPGDMINYGEMEHEIYFDKGEMSDSDLQIIGQTLTDFGYFTNEEIRATRVENINNKYILHLELQKEYWEDADLIMELNNLKYTLNTKTGNNFSLLLLDYDLSGKTFKKEM